MSGEGNGKPPEAPPSRIVITFAGQDRASMDIRPEGPITVAQIYGAAWLLDTWAHETRVRELMTAGTGLVAPPADLAGLLRQLGLGGPGRDG